MIFVDRDLSDASVRCRNVAKIVTATATATVAVTAAAAAEVAVSNP